MIWLCVTPERREKTERIMRALAAGGCGKVCIGRPPDHEPFAVWGHQWLSKEIIPPAICERRPYWFVDNGYWKSAKGQESGYYSLTYRGLQPVSLESPDFSRLPVEFGEWRTRQGGYVLLALPGMGYGQMLGYDMVDWSLHIQKKIRMHTDRRIVVREKRSPRKLEHDLAGAFVLVTHSSKVAVDAVKMGVPCIVEPTNPAAPVCGTDLAMIEKPPMPDRTKWWASLMCQQFTISEMRNGIAKHWMNAIKDQSDAISSLQAGLRLEADTGCHDCLQSRHGKIGDDSVRGIGDCQGQGGCGEPAPAEGL